MYIPFTRGYERINLACGEQKSASEPKHKSGDDSMRCDCISIENESNKNIMPGLTLAQVVAWLRNEIATNI